MTTETMLNPRQVAAIEALLEYPTRAEAAKAARVSERTLRRWVSQPGFAAALRTARGKRIDGAGTTLAARATACAAALVDMATGAVRASAPRVAAAKAALELAVMFDERAGLVSELAARVGTLEGAFAAPQTTRGGLQ